jgi:hypothetical protein
MSCIADASQALSTLQISAVPPPPTVLGKRKKPEGSGLWTTRDPNELATNIDLACWRILALAEFWSERKTAAQCNWLETAVSVEDVRRLWAFAQCTGWTDLSDCCLGALRNAEARRGTIDAPPGSTSDTLGHPIVKACLILRQGVGATDQPALVTRRARVVVKKRGRGDVFAA